MVTSTGSLETEVHPAPPSALPRGGRESSRVAVVESLRPRTSGSPPGVSERPKVGQHAPLHVVAVGLAILAFAEPTFQARYLEELDRRSPTDRSIASAALRDLARTRAEGYSATDRRTTPMMSIGAPVLGRAGRPLCSISIIVPPGSALMPYGHLVRSTARAVQRSAREQGLLT